MTVGFRYAEEALVQLGNADPRTRCNVRRELPHTMPEQQVKRHQGRRNPHLADCLGRQWGCHAGAAYRHGTVNRLGVDIGIKMSRIDGKSDRRVALEPETEATAETRDILDPDIIDLNVDVTQRTRKLELHVLILVPYVTTEDVDKNQIAVTGLHVRTRRNNRRGGYDSHVWSHVSTPLISAPYIKQ